MAKNADMQGMDRLDQVVRLLAVIAVKDMSQTDQIAVLDRVGLAPKEIAEIVGTTANTVRVGLVGIRKAAALGKKRRLGRNPGEETDG